jgi:hypothetical protein
MDFTLGVKLHTAQALGRLRKVLHPPLGDDTKKSGVKSQGSRAGTQKNF